jgi:protein tyrosine phosphatase (PTP) superfamily phosphohydrolase (DUF442 family)
MVEEPLSISEIQNYRELSALMATSGQPFRHQFPAIRSAGFETVINLAMPESLDAIGDEADLVRSMGIEHVSIPVVWEHPSLDDLDAFFACMDARHGKKLFVHCARNMRVSSFVFLYRVLRLGWTQEAARPDLLAIWQPNPTWQAFIDLALNRAGFPVTSPGPGSPPPR